jgi:hypothetical protein
MVWQDTMQRVVNILVTVGKDISRLHHLFAQTAAVHSKDVSSTSAFLCVCCAAACVMGWSCQAILSATTGDGHRAAVHSLIVPPGSPFMFSADRSGVIKVRRTGVRSLQMVPYDCAVLKQQVFARSVAAVA